jgi:hypothetical protein
MKDYKDWKPMEKNMKAYFKDKLPTDEDAFQCVVIPPFTICYGFFMMAPCIVECPLQCCKKKKKGKKDKKKKKKKKWNKKKTLPMKREK